MAQKPAATADENGDAIEETGDLVFRGVEPERGLRGADADAPAGVQPRSPIEPPASPAPPPTDDWSEADEWSAWDQLAAALPRGPEPAPVRKSRSGSETRARGKSVLVRFADEEFLLVETAASNSGLTVPSYTRAILLGEKLKTKSRHRPPVERELLARLLGQYGKIGSNLNQIAHAANLGEQPGKELEAALAELRVLNAQTMRAMGRKP